MTVSAPDGTYPTIPAPPPAPPAPALDRLADHAVELATQAGASPEAAATVRTDVQFLEANGSAVAGALISTFSSVGSVLFALAFAGFFFWANHGWSIGVAIPLAIAAISAVVGIRSLRMLLRVRRELGLTGPIRIGRMRTSVGSSDVSPSQVFPS